LKHFYWPKIDFWIKPFAKKNIYTLVMSNETENREWLNEYPALKQLNPANAFKVPVHYFDEMEGRVMDEICLAQFKQEHPQDGFVLPVGYFDQLTGNIESRVAIEQLLNTGEGFTVPEAYFDQLTQNINSRIAIDEALNADKIFTVPEGYFEGLTQNINSRIAIDELLNAEQGFIVPESYFEDLSQNIEGRIAVEELLNQEQGFSVPVNYFENLEARILQSTVGTPAPAKQNKVVVRTLWATNTFKYATAACFSLFVGAAILMSEFNNTAIHNRSDVHKALSKVSASDIESYLQLNSDAPTILENSDPNNLSNLSDAVEQ
jgi:hypothetical protein